MMATVYFLIGACVFFLFLAVLCGFILLASKKGKNGNDKGGHEVPGSGGGDRRDDAIANLHAAREKMRGQRPDLAAAAEQAQQEAMQREIESAGQADPRKAADNLQRMME